MKTPQSYFTEPADVQYMWHLEKAAAQPNVLYMCHHENGVTQA